jgi:hypothetical protein
MPGWVPWAAVGGLVGVGLMVWLDAQRPEWFYSRRAFEKPVRLGDPPDPGRHWVPLGGGRRAPADGRMWIGPSSVIWLSEEEARRVEGKLLGREPPELEDGR